MYVNEELLCRLFEISSGGKKCMGARFGRTEDGQTTVFHHEFITRKLFENRMAQDDLEIVAKVLEPNDLGVVRRILH